MHGAKLGHHLGTHSVPARQIFDTEGNLPHFTFAIAAKKDSASHTMLCPGGGGPQRFSLRFHESNRLTSFAKLCLKMSGEAAEKGVPERCTSIVLLTVDDHPPLPPPPPPAFWPSRWSWSAFPSKHFPLPFCFPPQSARSGFLCSGAMESGSNDSTRFIAARRENAGCSLASVTTLLSSQYRNCRANACRWLRLFPRD